MITFKVDGNPLPKQSFRVNSKGVKVFGYRDKRVTVWQDKVGWAARAKMGGRPPLRDDLNITIRFTRANKRRVDIDNLSKAVLDAMNGIVYKDDQQVKELHLYKSYHNYGKVEVEVRELT